MTHWSADPGSLVILGRTQTGKTVLAREVHAVNNRLSIFVNERGKDRVPGIRGKRVRSLRGLESGMANGTWKYNWLSADRESDIETLTDWAWKKAERSNRRLPLQICVDELHRVAPQSGKNDLPGRDCVRKIAKEGQKRNVKLVGITQDPIAMDKQSLRQREYLAVYSLSIEQGNYMGDYGVSVELVNRQPEHSCVVYHSNGEVLDKAVKASAKFAH